MTTDKNKKEMKEDKMKDILFQCFDILFANEQVPRIRVLDRKPFKKENRKIRKH